MGFEVKLIAPHFVSPYRLSGKTGKNDAADAAANCEAASRPSMRFVPVKSVEQQSMVALHRLREGYKEERTACINRIRGLLAEFGLVFAQRPEVLRAALAEVIEDASNELGAVARMALQRAASLGGCGPSAITLDVGRRILASDFCGNPTPFGCGLMVANGRFGQGNRERQDPESTRCGTTSRTIWRRKAASRR